MLPLKTSLVAACVVAALPATAQAATEYRVEAFGTGSYLLDVDLSDDDSTETSRVEATFEWRSALPSVHFDDARRFSHLGTPPSEPTRLTGTLKRAIRIIDQARPGEATIIDCEGALIQAQPLGSDALTGTDAVAHGIVFRPFRRVAFLDHGCSTGEGGPFGIFEDGNDPHGVWESASEHGEFDQVFELPPEAVGAGKVVQLVQPRPGQVIPVQCPGYSQARGERCTSKLEWSGQVVFTKIGETPDQGDDLITPLTPAPPVPAPPAPAPAPAPRPIDDGDDLITPLVPARASVDRSGRTVSFRAGCAAGCTGTAVLSTATTRVRAAGARSRRLVTLRFKVAAGAPRTVRLRLPAGARAGLRRARSARLAITLRGPGTATTRKALPLALGRR